MTAFDFYSQQVIHGIDTLPELKNRKFLVTMDKGLAELKQQGYAFEIKKQGVAFKVSELTPEFINPKTRSTTVKNYYLVMLK